MKILRRIKNDAWDNSNSLTQWYETVYECWECGGRGMVWHSEFGDGDYTCPECGGSGELVERE